MAEYKALTVKECAQRICEIENPLVLMHVRPDGDTIGSAAALCELFSLLGKKAVYACSDKIPDRLEFILEGATKLQKDDITEYALVSVDVPAPMQLGAFSAYAESIALMIDHHEVGTPFADNYIIKGESSAAEVVMRIAEELESEGKIKFTERLAFSLFAGISSDTGCFRYSNASAQTFRSAARLIECGIDAADINHRLFSSKSPEQIKAEGMAADGIRIAADGKIAYTVISRKAREAANIPFECFETSIDIVRAVKGAEIAFIIKETDSGEFKASIRSVGKDVAVIASEFFGGGHIRAAGCTPRAESIIDAADMIVNRIVDYYYSH